MESGHIIKQVLPGSIGEELELEPGDRVLEVNGERIEDVFDYRYLINDTYIEMTVLKKNGEVLLFEIDKYMDEDLGIEFESSLMDEYHSCTNKCIFCFIDQLPKGMRPTMYFKDDDSRLSFLQGNYITLTNMKDKDLDRIIRYKLSPINISVHTTNPELRCMMLHNRFAGKIMDQIQKLYEAETIMNGQIVLCKGVNDGKELEKTIQDLGGFLPFMESLSVVPVGISRHREGLYPLEPFDREDAKAVLKTIHTLQDQFMEEYGTHFVHASDEWYILAGRDFPEEERYDGYIQLENGVGMMRLLMEEFEDVFGELLSDKEIMNQAEDLKRTVTIATGKLTCSTIQDFADRLMEVFPSLTINVYAIRNDFFGETITVSGLITGQDLVGQLLEYRKQGADLGDTLIIPSNMLRVGEQVFLDDMTVQQAEEMLGMKITATEARGQDFIDAILYEDYQMDRENDEFVYVKGYPNE